jgi:hypothetical protein
MLRYLAVAVAVIVAILAVTQIVLPPLLAGKVEDRLTKRGGSASVDLDAVPALRLVAHDGDRFSLDGEGLRFPLDQRTKVFDRLDGFDSVRVRLRDVTAGPFTVRQFALTRGDGDGTYTLLANGESTVARVSGYLTSGLPPFVASLLSGAARGVTGPAADRRIPFALDAELRSDGGDPALVRGNGNVAGIPAGPLASLLAQAIVSRL